MVAKCNPASEPLGFLWNTEEFYDGYNYGYNYMMGITDYGYNYNHYR